MKQGLHKNFLINKLLKRFKTMLFITVYANAITIGLCELGTAGYTPTIVQFTFPRLNQIFSWLNPVAAYHRYQWRKIAKRLRHED